MCECVWLAVTALFLFPTLNFEYFEKFITCSSVFVKIFIRATGYIVWHDGCVLTLTGSVQFLLGCTVAR